MAVKIPAKVKARLSDGVKKYRGVLRRARDKDVNESDTVTIITDILDEVLGYKKITEITSECAIKKTFCDLAIKIDDKIKLLIEAKAIGLTLKDMHIKQAVDYGANAGVEWVVLTNGMEWQIYRIIFSRPLKHELVYSFCFAELNVKSDDDLELLYLLSKESISKPSNVSLNDFHTQKQIVNKFTIGQLLVSDVVTDCIRKNLKKISPVAKATNDEIKTILKNEIVKRDVFDDDGAVSAKKRVNKALRSTKSKGKNESNVEAIK